MKAQKGTVFLKLFLHLSLILLIVLHHQHTERDMGRERERYHLSSSSCTSQILLTEYHHQSRKRDPSLSSSFCIPHILLRAAPSKHTERGRERHIHTVCQALPCLSNFAQSVAPSKHQQTQSLSSSYKRF